MKGAWRQSGGVAAVADHLGNLGGAGFVGRARLARLCLYGLALTFAGFAVFLAFAPSLPAPPASSPAAAWFDGLIASASPYRVSGFLSSLFPANSSFSAPPSGVAARRGGPSGGGFAASGPQGGGSISSAVRPGEQLGSGGGVPSSSVGGAPSDAAAAVPSAAPPDDHVQGVAEAKHSTGSATAEAKSGPGPGLPSGGSAQDGTTAKGGVPVRINGSDANASSVDAGDGSGMKASARNAAGSTHQLGSGAAALGNGTAVPFINQTTSAVAAAMDGNGTASPADINQTLPIQSPADNRNHTRGSAASDGSSSSENKQIESTARPQVITPIANNNSTVLVKAAATAGRRKKVDWIENMASCDMFYGNWVRDDSYPLYPAGSCPHIDESFNCHLNGRPDKAYQRLRWQPSACRIPRKDYYQEGNRVYSELDVHDAYRRALNTWAKWVDSNVNPKKTTVFFRGYSASHFSGGQWNSGGSCDKETEPITNEKYLTPYPTKMSILEEVLHGMKTPVMYLNITRMTDYRKEAHPSVYRKQKLTEEERKSPELYQDCSHWCLPGVPDSWNEILYAQILVKQRHTMQQ
ncbi:protein trichome birefringence-like 1 [Panicum miliaceum]|uniref:Protein trichome birefringence-like 1 n=1 Tax=Panicum miliaceum TaxID=4540 RepID=A0A3L6RTV5_PANMI|nr:protein trichome birefringence-like 1 [Panicum miliaceum]